MDDKKQSRKKEKFSLAGKKVFCPLSFKVMKGIPQEREKIKKTPFMSIEDFFAEDKKTNVLEKRENSSLKRNNAFFISAFFPSEIKNTQARKRKRGCSLKREDKGLKRIKKPLSFMSTKKEIEIGTQRF